MNPRSELFTSIRQHLRTAIACGTLALFISCASAWAAQEAAILGTVVDPSGAVVVDATVTVQNADGGREEKCVTSNNGSFSFSALTPGLYRIRLEAPGFKPYLQDGIAVDGTTSLKLNVELVIDSENTTVEVSADNPEVGPSSTELGGTIPGKKLTSVPLNGRSHGFIDQ